MMMVPIVGNIALYYPDAILAWRWGDTTLIGGLTTN